MKKLFKDIYDLLDYAQPLTSFILALLIFTAFAYILCGPVEKAQQKNHPEWYVTLDDGCKVLTKTIIVDGVTYRTWKDHGVTVYSKEVSR